MLANQITEYIQSGTRLCVCDCTGMTIFIKLDLKHPEQMKKKRKPRLPESGWLSKSYKHGGKANKHTNKPKTLQQFKEPNKTKITEANLQTPHHELELIRAGLYLTSHALC